MDNVYQRSSEPKWISKIDRKPTRNLPDNHEAIEAEKHFVKQWVAAEEARIKMLDARNDVERLALQEQMRQLKSEKEHFEKEKAQFEEMKDAYERERLKFDWERYGRPSPNWNQNSNLGHSGGPPRSSYFLPGLGTTKEPHTLMPAESRQLLIQRVTESAHVLLQERLAMKRKGHKLDSGMDLRPEYQGRPDQKEMRRPELPCPRCKPADHRWADCMNKSCPVCNARGVNSGHIKRCQTRRLAEKMKKIVPKVGPKKSKPLMGDLNMNGRSDRSKKNCGPTSGTGDQFRNAKQKHWDHYVQNEITLSKY